MTQRRLFSVLTGCAVLAAAQSAAFGAGQFQFVSGDVKIISEAGAERVPAKGARIAEGESVATGRDSIAQIKMRDGAIVVVQSETRATVEMFRYAGAEDGSERFVMRIHRGGFRGITGAIGRTNKQNYRIETPIAQMGVRGTDHESYFFPQPDAGAPAGPRSGAYNKVNVGAMYLRTPAGETGIQPNQVAYVSSSESIPGLLPNVPEFFHRAAGVQTTGIPRPESILANAAAPGTNAPGVVQIIRIGSGSSDGGVGGGGVGDGGVGGGGVGGGGVGGGGVGGGGVGGGGINLSDPGSLPPAGPGPAVTVVGYVEPVGGGGNSFGRSGVNLAIVTNGSALVDTGNDAGLGVNWGSWQGPATVAGNPTAGWAHFASATSTTTAAQLAALPPGLVAATYNYSGGPAPTNEAGVQGTVNVLAATVNFSTQTITNYTLNATVDGKTWAATGNGSFANFKSSSGINLNGSCSACSGGGGPAGANGQAHGVFVGNAAQGMLTSFGLKSSQDSVSGAALLKR